MTPISKADMESVLQGMAQGPQDPGEFQKHWAKFFIGIQAGYQGQAFKAELYNRLRERGFQIAPSLSEDDWAAIAKAFNDGPLMHLVARKMSSNARNKHFPEIAKKYEQAGSGVGVVGEEDGGGGAVSSASVSLPASSSSISVPTPDPGSPSPAPGTFMNDPIVNTHPSRPFDSHCGRGMGFFPVLRVGTRVGGFVPFFDALSMLGKKKRTKSGKSRKKAKARKTG